jgi:pectinesterase
VKSLSDSYITAAATRKGQAYGFVFLHCRLIADTAVKKVYLGRPWRPYAKTVFIGCEIDSHIIPAGWDPWKGDAMFPDKERTAFYVEYGNTGAGAVWDKRVDWAKQLTKEEAAHFSLREILGGADNWVPVHAK